MRAKVGVRDAPIALITLVDKNRQGDLLTRIKGVRRKFAQEVGFLPPPVHVRDNLELKPSGYRITLRGVIVGEGEAFPGMFLAINPGGISTPLIGTPTTDPAFGLPAHWIDAQQKEAAQMAGFTVVDSETVMATHLSHLMQVQAAKLLSRTETQQLVEHVAKQAPKLIEEVVAEALTNYDHVTVIAEWGNHGRLGSKRDAIPKSDNLDRMTYELARQRLDEEPRLTWEDCPEDIQRVEIGNYRALLMHGDEVGRSGFASPAAWQAAGNR